MNPSGFPLPKGKIWSGSGTVCILGARRQYGKKKPKLRCITMWITDFLKEK